MAHTSKTATRSKTTTQKPMKAIAGARKTRAATAKPNEISPERRQEMIAEAAYLRAEQRGFGPGDPMEDWLVAEREVDLLLAGHTTSVAQ